MKQLDVEVSTPVNDSQTCNLQTFKWARLPCGLATCTSQVLTVLLYVTCQMQKKICENHVFEPGDLDIWPMILSFTKNVDIILVNHNTKSSGCKSKWFPRYDFLSSDFLSSDFLSSLNFGPVTDRHPDRQKAMHMSPSCMCTGVLKNVHRPPAYDPKVFTDPPQFHCFYVSMTRRHCRLIISNRSPYFSAKLFLNHPPHLR